MAQPRWVVVDDNDGGIQYSSGWTAISGSAWDKQGNFGPTYLESLHMIQSAGSFSYTYNGADAQVVGTTSITKDASGNLDPTWECQVDGVTIPQNDPFPYTENNWALCQWDSTKVSAGTHKVTVNVKSNGRAFLVDQFRYVPSSGVNLQNVVMLMNFQDPKIQYGDGWSMLGSTAKMATSGGATITIPFYGTGLSWYSFIPIEMGKDSTTAEYTIDGGSATTINVPGPYNGLTMYNQLVLSVHGLSRSQHTLKVTSKGTSSNQTPLVLEHLLIENGATQDPPISGGTPLPSTTGNVSPSSIGAAPSRTSGTTSASSSSVLPLAPLTLPTSLIVPPSSGGDSSSSGGNNGTSTGTSSNNGGSSASNSNQGDRNGQSTSTSSSMPTGTIIGGVIGGLALIVLILLLVLCYRRQNRKKQPLFESNVVQPFYNGPVSVSGAQPQPHPTLASTPYRQRDSFTTPYPQTGSSFYPAPRSFTDEHPHSPTTDAYGSPMHQSEAHVGTVGSSGSLYRSGSSSEHGYSTTSGSSVALLRPVRGPAFNSPINSGFNSKFQESRSQESHFQPTSPSSQQPLYSSTSRIINHEDSGVRIPRNGASQVVEFPPSYTPA